MFRNAILVGIFLILSYGFWVSPDFKIIAAGVSVFLFGMIALEEGFKAFAGGLLEKILGKSTDRLWKSMSFGVVSTTLMQSSSLVSIITISFLSAGLITLVSGIGIVFGANLGTTTGAWLVAGFGLKVNISAYAMPMLVFGTILLFQNSQRKKGLGYILAGLGFLFLGIHYMKEGFEAFQGRIDLSAYAVSGYLGLLLYTLIGVVATVIMQSSHATLILIITALATGHITYENALALAIGSNIGTTITAILGSISANINGKRLAGAHLVFNLVTGLVAIIFISPLMTAVDRIADTVGIAPDDYTLKLAVFHTLFNVLGILLMTPLIGRLVSLLYKVMPEKKKRVAEPLYLSNAAIGLPDTALEATRKESFHLFDNVFVIICKGLSFRPEELTSKRPLKEIIAEQVAPIPINIDEEYETMVKSLYGDIVYFSSRAQAHMSHVQTDVLFNLRHAGANMLEAIKDTKHLHKNLAKYIRYNNTVIKEEYNDLRYKLGGVMRGLHEMREDTEDGGEALLSLDRMRKHYEDADKDFLGRLDALIRDEKVTAAMATSLVNDHHYANSIAESLFKAGASLFTPIDIKMKEAQESLLLDETEVAAAMMERAHKEQAMKQ